jgi:hypothetical protein
MQHLMYAPIVEALLAMRVRRARTQVASGAEGRAELYAATLLAEIRAEVDRADRKAQTALAAAGVAIGVLLTGLTAGHWSPFQLTRSMQWLWWAGIAAAIGGLWCLASAVYPRGRGRGLNSPGMIAYFGDAVGFKSPADLASALRSSAAVNLERLADQIFRMSMIVDRKYQLVIGGMWLLFAAAAGCFAAVIGNVALR